jgi:hypothetical protein
LAPDYAGLGYNGRGIAAATMMGRDLATLVRGARRCDGVSVDALRARLASRRADADPRSGAGLSVRDMVDEYRLRRAADKHA